MGISIFNIGISGMNAAQAGLITAGHNITNAATPGYSREEVVQTTNVAQATGAGFFGQGVAVKTVRRLYSDALSGQLTSAQAQGGQIDAYNAQIKQLSNMFGDPSAGLAPAVSAFFGGLADLASHPESVPSRQALLASAGTLTARFRDLDLQMSQMRSNINSEITTSITSINGFAQQIAYLNQQIVTAEGGSAQQQTANDLRDQRDALVASLNKEVRGFVIKEDSGAYDIFIGNGQPIVLGNQVFGLSATPSAEDPQRVMVGYSNGASISALAESSLQGGTLGGLLSFRRESLDSAQNALGRVAVGMTQSLNAQHALGQDLNGVMGGDLFSVDGPAVVPSSNNTGSAAISATVQDVSALTTSDYLLQYKGQVAGSEDFLLTRLSDGRTTSASFASATGYPHSLQVDGLSVTLSAGAVVNDRWTIEPTRFAASSIRLALSDTAAIAAAAPIRTAAALTNSSRATISAGAVTSVVDLPLAATVTLTFNAAAGQFAVSGAVPPVSPITYSAGSPIGFNGLSFSITGTPSNGDSFTISRNTGGSADNRNALALGLLQTTNTLSRNAAIVGATASASFNGAYSEMVSQIGNTARQTEVMAAAQANVIVQAKQAVQSLSGVNLDEEAANLLRFQQAYQASGKMMQIASSLFQSVLDLAK
jgi:flagellar hook-associated protein 1 FlgK